MLTSPPTQEDKGNKGNKTKQNSSKSNEETGSSLEFCVVPLKHCFHINTINSIIGMSQVLDKLFFLI